MNAPAANIVQIEANRRLVLEALAQSAAPADRVRIAKLSGLNADTVAAHLADLERAGIVERFDRGARKMSLWSLISAPAPTATDGEPGDGSPGEDQDETTARAADPLPLADPGVDDTEEALARRQIDLARELQALGHQPSEIDDPADFGDDEAPAADDRTGSLLALAVAAAVAAGECPAVGTVTIVVPDQEPSADGSIYSALLTASTVHDSAAVVAEQQAAELLARAAEARTVASRIVGLSDALRGLNLDTAVLVLDRARAALGRA